MSDTYEGLSYLSARAENIYVVTMTLKSFLQVLAVGAALCLPGCTDTSPAFDIPALIGKDIAEVGAILGQPSGEPSEPALQNVWRGNIPGRIPDGQPSNDYWMWERRGWSLMLNFDIKKHRAINYQLSPKDGGLKDLADAMAAGNLRGTAALYTLRPLFTHKHPGEYTGLVITPR